MNINLGQRADPDETLQDRLEEHRVVMVGADIDIIGPAVLIPVPGADYPGAYQVWWPARTDDIEGWSSLAAWVWINPDGEAQWELKLPEAFEMRNE